MDKFLVKVKANIIKILEGFNIIIKIKSYINELTEILMKIINIIILRKKV